MQIHHLILAFHERADLHKHVVENEEEIDGLWCHNKYMKATSGLIKMDSLHLTTILKCTCKNNKISVNPDFENMRNSWEFQKEMPHLLLWSQIWESQCRRGWHLHYKLWTQQRPPVYTRPARCCQEDTEEVCWMGMKRSIVLISTLKLDYILLHIILPACILLIRAEVHHKSTTLIKGQSTPNRVCPEFGLSLVVPRCEYSLRSIHIFCLVPDWTIRAHVLRFPGVWGMAIRNSIPHGLGNFTRVFSHPNLTESSIANKFWVSICYEAWKVTYNKVHLGLEVK